MDNYVLVLQVSLDQLTLNLGDVILFILCETPKFIIERETQLITTDCIGTKMLGGNLSPSRLT
jgi:hypothetical protein